MNEPDFTESFIRSQTTPQSFQRGCDYYYDGAVSELERRGEEIQASVAGSGYAPYRVRVAMRRGEVESATCTCPYDWGGWCKHIVAVLLSILHEPDRVAERPALDALLDDLDRDQLQALVQHLAHRRPDLVADVESWLVLHPTGQGGAGPIDPAPFRQRVRDLLHSLDHMRPSEAYWQVGTVIEEIRQVLADVESTIGKAEGEDALILLEAITDTFVQEWTHLDDSDGYVHDFFSDLGTAWTEALMAAGLTPEGRAHWAGELDRWQDELSAYGLDDVFWTARCALEDEDTWEEDGFIGEELAVARLHVLARQEKYDEYLAVAEASGQYLAYALMLVQVGRHKDAFDAGRRYLASVDGARALAQALYQAGAAQSALGIAEYGLTLQGEGGGRERGELAVWLRDHAERMGRPDRALAAALVAAENLRTLNAYRKAEALAGEEWPTHKDNLLNALRQKPGYALAQEGLDIFLYEGSIDEAIAIVQEGYAGYDTLRRVTDVAVRTHPEWVRDTARRQAEEIMDEGRSNAYKYAADWLRRVRDAYRVLGDEATWESYLDELKDKHRRKYALMPLLREL